MKWSNMLLFEKPVEHRQSCNRESSKQRAQKAWQMPTDKCSRAVVPGQSTHFPRKSHTMPPICWGAADTEGGGSEGALPPGRGEGRAARGGGLGHSEGVTWGHDGRSERVNDEMFKNSSTTREITRGDRQTDRWHHGIEMKDRIKI